MRHGLKVRSEYDILVQPNPLAKMHKSRIGLWRLLPKRKRVIAENSMIHNSVLTRKQHDSKYHPRLPVNYEIAL